MRTLEIDIETFSSVSLQKCGVYKYAESPDFQIILFGYSVDSGEVKVVDLLQGETLPQDILDALTDDTVVKWAHNSGFERVCLSRYLADMGVSLDPFRDNHTLSQQDCTRFLNPTSWRCSMTWAAYLGLPLSLSGVGEILGLEKKKLTEGKELVKFFCQPCAPTKANSGRVRNLPSDAPEKWDLFKSYNLRDVEVEMQITQRLSKLPVPDFVWDEYHLSEEINDRGIGVDMPFVSACLSLDAKSTDALTDAMRELTALENPNSVAQVKGWLADNGLEIDTLGKKEVSARLKTAPAELVPVLQLRQQLAKSSVKKYTAMENAVCTDSRVRGMLMFLGASRTGRFAGRLVQLQNLPQNHIPDLDEARALAGAEDYDALEMLYEDIPDTLSQLIRTAFVPQNGRKFIVADFSAIEARVISWFAKEQWKLDAFAKGEDIYCATASQMFLVPVIKHGVNGELRQKGKVAELACGYGGSVGALKAMGALEMGLKESELQPIVDSWRGANPNIVKFWWAVDRAAKAAIRGKTHTTAYGVEFSYESGFLFIKLPSDRRLAYVKPRIGENRFGGEAITYEGTGGTKKWERLETYGPKLVENIVQATSRDILCHAMKTLRCCNIVAHVHDEVIIEADRIMSLDVVCEQMGRTPPWAPGLILSADGYECDFYKKD
ncbi:phage encoded DNA-directed DNA polymerase [Dehalococcoides mccartyi BTF08]|uniref:DNA polymerase n=1 Tax=Dehalococcoides mccartyi TaxID=61435 RepID=UPI0002B75F84|nr:phage encoded DNA-directed DNA polymerase [Dehalococcoides mccartyi BTF08]